MSIQRYGLVRETNERGREEARIAPLDLGDLVGFVDHAAALAAKDAGAREAAFRAFIEHRGVDVPCQSCRGLGTRLYGSTATWHGGAGGQTVTTDICDRCWGSGDEERHGVNLRTLAGKDAEVAAAVAMENERIARLVEKDYLDDDFPADNDDTEDDAPSHVAQSVRRRIAKKIRASRPTPGAAKEDATS